MIPHRAVLLDLDGTVYRSSQPVSNAARAVTALLDSGKSIRYLTNNSAARPDEVTKKLTAMGIPCEPDWVYTSALVTARYCVEQRLQTVFPVGQHQLSLTLQEHGLTISEKNPEAVVVGICRSFTYDLMNEAMQHILGGAKFIATNPDPTYPIENGRFVPGTGSIVAAIQTCSGVLPTMIGKPSPRMPLTTCKDLGLEPQDAVMVGDRISTDIESGRAAGCATWLVLTGVESRIPPGQAGSDDLLGLVSAI